MDQTHSGYKSHLAHEMMKVVFSRIGRTDIGAARAMIAGFTKEQSDTVMAEAKALLAAQ